jgi:maltooligosyltrehalose trehalohydrolase
MSKSCSKNSTARPDGRVDPRPLSIGAELLPDKGGVRFRVWAPEHQSLNVVFESSHEPVSLQPEGNGYFSAVVGDLAAGVRYKYQIDSSEAWPDPASRFQPNGPADYSEVIDPHAFVWSDQSFEGVQLQGQVIYEMHLGTFTREGNWSAATERLSYLHHTGITLIEVMPVADFPGRFGWGYDGVLQYAPASIYGTPDDMRHFVDRAHSFGIGVILDVVYNHLGPEHNYLPKFSRYYLSEKHKTDWGPAINFDGDQSEPVRSYFLSNVAYWIGEFHLDGLRIDATQDINDNSETHILREIVNVARETAGSRSVVLIGENEPQNTLLIRPQSEGGYGLDALWNDDFHHAAMVALAGKADAYYTDYRARPQEFISALKYGYLYQGQWYRWQKQRRGSSNLGLPRPSMVTFIQNHDQVANSATGQRAHVFSAPGVLRAITALMLLGPGTPMLFQGQEFGASSPFFFFADHEPEISKLVDLGRLEFLEQWRSLRSPEMKGRLVNPCLEDTFNRSKLDFAEVQKHATVYALHRDLLRLRSQDAVFRQQGKYGIDGAVLSDRAFVIRFFSSDFKDDRLLLINLGPDADFDPCPEPLLAAPSGSRWTELWSSDSAEYGGCGIAPVNVDAPWVLSGYAAVVLRPVNP